MKYNIKNNIINLKILFIIYFLISPGIANAENSVKPRYQIDKLLDQKNFDKAIELNLGSFYKGFYTFYRPTTGDWDSCNFMTFCNIDKNMYDSIIGFKLINRKYKNNNNYIDFDYSISITPKSKEIDNKNINRFKPEFMISLVPTYRSYKTISGKTFNYGVGLGLNYSRYGKATQSKKELNSQINLEIGYQIFPSKKTDIVLNLQHICNFLGVFDGKIKGTHWYSIGIRRWM